MEQAQHTFKEVREVWQDNIPTHGGEIMSSATVIPVQVSHLVAQTTQERRQ